MIKGKKKERRNLQLRLGSDVATTADKKLPKGVNIGLENLGAQPTTTCNYASWMSE